MSSRVRDKQAKRVVREQLAREARRRRTIWTTAVAVTVLLIAGLVGWGIVSSQSSSSYKTPGDATADASGLVVGSGPVTVETYVDFMCPVCGRFETTVGPTLDQLVADKKITLVYHPVAFLDSASTSEYSTRSSASAACASDGGKFPEYVKALYAQQPAEGSAGLSDDQLVQIGGSVGLVDPAFAKCVRGGDYRSWTAHVTDEAAKRGVNGTPTVFVNGKQTDATVAAITAAVQSPGA